MLLILSLSILQGKAQGTEGAGDLKFGIKGGVNVSTLTTRYIGIRDLRLGYQFGGFVAYSLTSSISAEVDVLYASLGSNAVEPGRLYLNFPGYYEEFETKVRLNTLEIPVLINFSINDNARFFVGPEINFYLSGIAINTGTMYVGDDLVKTTSRNNVTGSFVNYDFAGVAGVGYNLSDNMSIDLRYRLGLTRANAIRSFYYKDFSLTAFSVNLGYSF